MSTWLITGCSSGLGRSLATVALDHGHNVVATARNVGRLNDLVSAYPDRALALPLDVTQPDQVRPIIEAGEARFGAIDVLVNNAGYGYRAAIEEGADEDVRLLFDTHFFGAIEMIKAVLPGMRSRRSGAIVNISSISARMSPPGSGYYSAAKAALEAATASLRKELEPLGISVFAVEPRAFRTDFAGRSLQQSSVAIEDYAQTAGKRRIENSSTHGTQPGDPQRAARAIMATVADQTPPQLLLLGKDAIQGIRGVLQAQLTELESWKELGLTTDL